MFEATAPTALSQNAARKMLPTIKRIAHELARRLPRHVRVEDLVGAGLQGLVAAHARFDATRGDALEAYAEFRIRGAMLDELRASDPLSRDQRAIAKQTAQAARAACARLGHAPNAEEIAAELGVSMEAYWERTFLASTVVITSIDGDDEERVRLQIQDMRAEPADEHLARKEQRAAVNRAIAALPPRLTHVLDLYYVEGWTLKEIGAELGVTESRVSQLVSEAIRRIRASCREPAVRAAA